MDYLILLTVSAVAQLEQEPLVSFEYGTSVGFALLGVRLVALVMFICGCLRSLFRAPTAVQFYLKFTPLYSLWYSL